MNNNFNNLVEQFNTNEYTYIYNGFRSTLDYAFANDSINKYISDAYVWHINTHESSLRDYNTTLESCRYGTFKPDKYAPRYIR